MNKTLIVFVRCMKNNTACTIDVVNQMDGKNDFSKVKRAKWNVKKSEEKKLWLRQKIIFIEGCFSAAVVQTEPSVTIYMAFILPFSLTLSINVYACCWFSWREYHDDDDDDDSKRCCERHKKNERKMRNISRVKYYFW